MSHRPDGHEFVLPPTADEDALEEFLAARFTVVRDTDRRGDRTPLDTADRRLRTAGLELDLARVRGGARLELREPGLRNAHADVPLRAKYLAADLPDPLHARLAPLLDVRALLPVLRLRTHIRDLRVVDGQQKTVLRIRLERAEVPRPGGEPVVLHPRLHLAGVLGYPKPLERVRAALEEDLGLHPATGRVLDEAVLACGLDPAGLRSKPEVCIRPGDRADEAAVAVCVALADIAWANVPGAIADLDAEFLHDLRVSVRRTRSVLRELEGVFPPYELQHFRDELKWVQAATGPVRDLDVQLEEWDGLVAPLDAATRADLDALHALLVKRRGTALRRLRSDLKGRRFEQVWTRWSELLASDLGPLEERPDAARPISAVAGRRIRSVYAKMVRMGSAIDDDSPAEDLHDLRKRGKELRYLLEFFGGLWPDEVSKPMVKTLKGLQDVLGNHEDRHVQVDRLRASAPDVAKGPRGPQAVLALGRLTERLERDQAAARAEFASRFAPFADPAQRKLVDRTFRKGGAR